ncbi:MAG: hypothetical protein E7473_11390, partial [Ruminococcaceae bacterium]|nr:hypothetical protein [Oscillospiraceae bacterium]
SYDASYFEGLTGFGASPNVDSSKTTPWSVASMRYVLNATTSGTPSGGITSDGIKLLLFTYRYFDEATTNGYVGTGDWFMGWCTHVAIVIDIPSAGKYNLAMYNDVAQVYGGHTEVRFGKAENSNIDEFTLTNIYNAESTQKLGWHDSSKVHNGSEENPAEDFYVEVTEQGKYVLIFATPNGTWAKNYTTVADGEVVGASAWQHQTFNLSKIVLSEQEIPFACRAALSEKRIETGKKVQISAEGYAEDGSELPETVTFSYEVENESIASVSDSGEVTGLKEGDTRVKVTANCGKLQAVTYVTLAVRDFLGKEYVYNFTSDALLDSFDVDAFNATVLGAKDSYDASYFEGLTGFGSSPNVDSAKTNPWSVASMRFVLNATTSGTPSSEITPDGLKLLFFPYRYFDEATPNTYKGTGDWFMGWCTHTAIVIDVPTAGTYNLGMYNKSAHAYGGHAEVRFGKAKNSNIDEFTLTNIYNDPDTQTLGWHDSSKVHDGSEENPAESFFVNVPEAGKYVLIFATPNGTWNKNMLTVADGDVLGMSAYQHQTFNLSKVVLAEKKIPFMCRASIETGKLYIGESSQIVPEGYMGDGSALPGEVSYTYAVDNDAVVSVSENGKVTALSEGEANITVTAHCGELTAETILKVSVKIPLEFSGVDTQYRFFELSPNWDPITNPVEGFSPTTRKEDVRGITYAYTSMSGEGNWQYNMTNATWIPDMYAVFLYGGVLDSTYSFLRFDMPKAGDWIALDIKVPEAGKYLAEYMYLVSYQYSSVSDIYILPKNETTDTTAEIESALTEDNYLGRVDYLDTSLTATALRSKEFKIVEFDKAGEYLLVIKRADNSRGGYIFPKMLSLHGVNRTRYVDINVNKTTLMYGESVKACIEVTRVDGSVVSPDDYTVSITSSNPESVDVTEDGTITAIGDGIAAVQVRVTDKAGNIVSSSVDITAIDNTGIKEIGFDLPASMYVEQLSDTRMFVTMNSGNVLNVPSDEIEYSYDLENIVSVDSTGRIIALSEGTVTITATAEYKGESITATATVTVIVDDRKREPTYYTYAMRDAVRENTEKYDWAKDIKKKTLIEAEKFIERYETMYSEMPGQGIPISLYSGLRSDPENTLCRYCGTDVRASYGSGSTGGWVVNPSARPWKIQCPHCKRLFPSNDFEKLYELGRDQAGYYSVERAVAANEQLKLDTNGETDYLRNDLYPEITESNLDPLKKDAHGNYYVIDGSRWGVDDGFGYRPGRTYPNGEEECHVYIGHYLFGYFNDVQEALTAFSDAYVMTGDAKYGRAGAILLDRVADVYPSFDLSTYELDYPASDGGTGRGKILGCINDAVYIRQLALECDALFPALEDPQVINFLSEKAEIWGLSNDKSTPEKIWDNWENGILDEGFRAMQRKDIDGNFGMKQYALACAAIVRDREPKTREMIEWIYNTDTSIVADSCTGGSVMSKLVDAVDRDGMGNEGSPNYNGIWLESMYKMADVLALYKGEGNFNLYENPKFTQMFTSFMPIYITESHTAEIGDSGAVAHLTANDSLLWYLSAFDYLKDTDYGTKLANYLYMRNGYTAKGLNYGLYAKDPERLEKEILERIDPDYSAESEIMTGFGFGILRDGIKTKNATSATKTNSLRDAWIYFGITSGHGHFQMLHLGLDAFGLNIAPDTGYPEQTGTQPNRLQWVRTTVSHNTVTVNEKEQQGVTKAATPLYFEDAGKVKVIDVEAPEVYDETSQYRRCAIMIEANDEVSYTVDFFRVKGGDHHTYSFHSQAEDAYAVEGLDMTEQKDSDGNWIGSYADINWPVGQDPNSPAAWEYDTEYPRGYSWMGKVRRDSEMESGKFAVEFDVQDYRKAISDSKGIKLRMTQVNDFSPTEVAITSGPVPNATTNKALPETLDYVLVQRKGKELDSLFTTVFEPYRTTRYISDIGAVETIVTDGTENEDDVVRALRITHTNGRVDYVVYATNNKVTYNVADLFDFRGNVGVYSINQENTVVYRYVANGDVIGTQTNTASHYVGTVIDHSKELSLENYIDVKMDCDNIEDIVGRYISVENDGICNAVYKIENASRNDSGTIRLDVGKISLIREHRDKNDSRKGYVYNIQANQKFSIPMSFIESDSPVFSKVEKNLSITAGSMFNMNVKAESPIQGNEVSYIAITAPRGAFVDSATGAINWKPSSSQVGVNHFAITAVDNDGRENTIHFDVSVYGSTTGKINSGGPGDGGADVSSKPDTPAIPENPEVPVAPVTPEVPDENVRFIDLGNHAWAEDAINSLADEGIIKGTSENTFSPGNNITRADFALLLVRAFELESENTENFSDVLDSDYFAKELAIARNTGIVNGIGDNKYAPKNTITRQDMMLIVYRALTKLNADIKEGDVAKADTYEDFSEISDYAKEEVTSLVNAGLVNGKSGKIAPTEYTTRAEVAVLISRIMKYVK